MCLYRIVELSAGSITIDGRDIAGVPLRVLRARLSIIPQDPVLFTGRSPPPRPDAAAPRPPAAAPYALRGLPRPAPRPAP